MHPSPHRAGADIVAATLLAVLGVLGSHIAETKRTPPCPSDSSSSFILIIFLLGGFSGRFGGYGYGYGHGGVGLIGIIVIILIVLLLMEMDLEGSQTVSAWKPSASCA